MLRGVFFFSMVLLGLAIWRAPAANHPATARPEISDQRHVALHAGNEALRTALQEQLDNVGSLASRLVEAKGRVVLGVGDTPTSDALDERARALQELSGEIATTLRETEPRENDTEQALNARHQRLQQLLEHARGAADATVKTADRVFEDVRANNDGVATLISGVRSDAMSVRDSVARALKK